MAYQAELETVWRNLRPHIEWARGFTLVYLFARHPAPVDFLRGRLADSMIINSLPLRVLPFNGPATVETTLNALLSCRPLNAHRPPIWLEMWRESADKDWQTARRQVLARLNERRFLLERDVDCPLVLVLPAELRGAIANLAPDLWTVRVFTADLPMPDVVIAPFEPGPAPSVPVLVENETPDAAEREWRRLWDNTPDKKRIDIWAGVAAVEAALARMDISAAQHVAVEVMQAVRTRPNSDAADQRLLSIALALQGDVAIACGNLDEALGAYRESLEIFRRLFSTSGDALQSLRDLSVSLIKVGDVEQALGRLDHALPAYRESLEISRRLRSTSGAAPESLRDLSVSLIKVGGVEQALGRLDDARSVFLESLEIRRRLRVTNGDTPQNLRDLSVSLHKLGSVEEALGRLDEALEVYRESLELRRRLRATTGDAPQLLSALIASLIKVGDVEVALGRRDEALIDYRESLEISRRLRSTSGDAPQTLRNLGLSLDRMGGVAAAQGLLKEARAAYCEDLDLCRRLRMVLGDLPQVRNDLHFVLKRLAEVEQRAGDAEIAARLEQEAAELEARVS